MKTLHIIEPTLHDETGHCCGYVTSLLEANQPTLFDMELWIDRRGKTLFEQRAATHGYFYRRWRILQLFWLYRRLLKQRQAFFVPTAGRIDLAMLHYLAQQRYSLKQVALHFHQFRRTEKKLKFLQQVARQYPDIAIFTPTQQLTKIFSGAGFRRAEVIACPTYAADATANLTPNFCKLLYAGAARMDKGFAVVTDLVRYLATTKQSVSFEIQASAPHSGSHNPRIEQCLKDLRALSVPWLKLYTETLTRADYQNLFIGSICIQPYQYEEYHDKFSGVLLDAMYAGCPVITTADTWMGDVVQRFESGIVMREFNSPALWQACQHIISDYATFQANAYQAGQQLRQEHDPRRTLKLLQRRLFIKDEGSQNS